MSESEQITVKLPNRKPKPAPSRGRMMDFAPRRQPVTSRPATVRTQPRPQTTAQRATTTVQSPRPRTSTPVRSSQSRIATSVRSSSPRPARMSAPRPDSSSTRSSKPRTQSSRSALATTESEPIQPLEAYNDLDNYTDFDDLTLGIIEDLDEPLDQRMLEQSPAPEPEKPKKYGLLPMKAPFINTDKLEKRPLSALRADKSNKSTAKPRKNVYASRLSEAPKEKDAPTLVTTSASKKSSFGLIIAIIITIVLGAIVGGIAYLAFFQ